MDTTISSTIRPNGSLSERDVSRDEIMNIQKELIEQTENFISVPESAFMEMDGGEDMDEETTDFVFEGALRELRSKRYEAELYLNTERRRNRDCHYRRIDSYGETTLEQNFDVLFNFTKRSFTTLSAEGDGRCLLNSISRGLVGCECLTDRLKSLITIEILSNITYYFREDPDWQILNLNEFFNTMSPLKLDSYIFMEQLHIRALSNVLQTPILVMNALSRDHIENSHPSLFSNCILPLRKVDRNEYFDEETSEIHEDFNSKQNRTEYPVITIAWQNGVSKKEDEEFENMHGHLLGSLYQRREYCYDKFQHYICVVPTIKISKESLLINAKEFTGSVNMFVYSGVFNNEQNATIHPLRLLCIDPTPYLVKALTSNSDGVLEQYRANYNMFCSLKTSNGFDKNRRDIRNMIKALLIAPRWIQQELLQSTFRNMLNNIKRRCCIPNADPYNVLIKLPLAEYVKYKNHGLSYFFHFFNFQVACNNSLESFVDINIVKVRKHIYMGIVLDHSDNALKKYGSQYLKLIMQKEIEYKVVYMNFILTNIRLWDQQISLNRLYSPTNCLNSDQRYNILFKLMNCWEELFCLDEQIAISMYNLSIETDATTRMEFIEFLIDLFVYIKNYDKIRPITDEADDADVNSCPEYTALGARCLDLYLKTQDNGRVKDVLSAIGFNEYTDGVFQLYPFTQGTYDIDNKQTEWYYYLNITREDIPKFLDLLMRIKSFVFEVPICFDDDNYQNKICLTDDQLKDLGIPVPSSDSNPSNQTDNQWIVGKFNSDSEEEDTMNEHLQFLSHIDIAIFNKWMMLQKQINPNIKPIKSVSSNHCSGNDSHGSHESKEETSNKKSVDHQKMKEDMDIVVSDKLEDRIPSNPTKIERESSLQRRDEMREIYYHNQPTMCTKIEQLETAGIADDGLSRQNSQDSYNSVEASDTEMTPLPRSCSAVSRDRSVRSNASSASKTIKIHYTAHSEEIIGRAKSDPNYNNNSSSVIDDTSRPTLDMEEEKG